MEMSPLVSAVLSFVFVIGLLLATLWFVRSRGIGLGPMNGQGLRVVNSLRLGGKHRLDVVEYGGRRLLIGVAPNQITLLDNQAQDAAATDTGPSEASDTMPTAGEPSSALSFAGQLKQFMQRD
ncbi:MAG: flagellar biosynthetic protein FliO [Proteobacteria bacterium]|jgi:flagellar biosynthetic protein FliO|nr:flagellar biosynthetic protein FliO [Pseudomonadota bacterium]